MVNRQQRSFPGKTARQFRLIRTRRTWLQRFWDPQSLVGLKFLLLGTCFLLSSLIGP